MSEHVVMNKFGYFGKVPFRGDFIQDKLPSGFVESWNEWLQATSAVSREQLAERWLDCYLTSPIWHFALSPGVCGDKAMVGTLMPSVDAVGRHYYFTLASEVKHPITAYWAQRKWSEKSEDIVLQLLDEETDFAIWASELNRHDLFEDLTDTEIKFEVGDCDQSHHKILITDGPIASPHLLHQAYTEAYGQYCLWWTSGSDRVPACTLVTRGLPLVGQYSAMLDGKWLEWGW